MDDKEIHLNDVTETTLSQFINVDRTGKNKENYKRVDIYWPLPMLKVNPLFKIYIVLRLKAFLCYTFYLYD